MLILTRHPNQSITLHHEALSKPVVVRILRCSQNEVRIGVDAPMDVDIFRDDIQSKKRKDRKDFDE